ncbi:hypothetical protein [Rhizobium sp. Root1220]|uniref:hypothetical protein n=1 Tax=Rhizobium sp. Root1220 TaxID=1736432 RepID=UPI0006F753D5|nr:hypothetical protein [Rhizobium sp. Root1220]KQV81873.1 hypothetical protein ASC90_24795 [Rhizobium sp. Root1220]
MKVRESTKTSDKDTTDAIRIIRERDLLEESIFGKKVTVTFQEAADAYLQSGGSARYLSRCRPRLERSTSVTSMRLRSKSTRTHRQKPATNTATRLS